MNNQPYQCAKCRWNQCDVGEVRVAGGFWSKIFDVQGRKFTSIICRQCGYTELYKGDSSVAGNIFDFMTN
jgi:predicted nucleic-acid-binding Zn-ribbon protein